MLEAPTCAQTIMFGCAPAEKRGELIFGSSCSVSQVQALVKKTKNENPVIIYSLLGRLKTRVTCIFR